MRQIAITAVMQDGTTPSDGSPPLEPFAQQIQVPQWTDCQLDVSCVGADGDAFDIEGGALIFSARRDPTQDDPDLSFEATITDGLAGLCTVTIGSNDTGAIEVASYGWTLVFIDAGGKIWPVVGSGRLGVTYSEYDPGQDVTVPNSQQPLAQGPIGLNWRGLWDSGTTYAPRDGVQYADPNGGGSSLSSFYALDPAPALGVPPLDNLGALNTGWAYLAERGAKGADGTPGQDGPQGPPGPGSISWLGSPATWTDLYAEISAQGDVAVAVNVYADLVIPAGAWELSKVTWIGQPTAGGQFPRVQYSDGAIITASVLGRVLAEMVYVDILGKILDDGNELVIDVAYGTVVTISDVAASALTGLSLYLDDASYLSAALGAPVFLLGGGVTASIACSNQSAVTGNGIAFISGGAGVNVFYDVTSAPPFPAGIWADGVPTFYGQNLPPTGTPLCVVRIADGAVVAGTLGKASTTAGKQVTQFLAGDDPALITCTIIDDGADGDPVRCAEIEGQTVLLKSDGVDAIPHGAGVDPSAAVDGRVCAGVGILGYNVGPDVAASLDETCEVL